VTPDLTLHLAELGFATPLARIAAVNGAFRLVELWPPATPPGQVLRARIEASDLPPADLYVESQLLPRPALRLEHVSLGFAGGEITAPPLVIDPTTRNFETVLTPTGVDLAEITTLLGIDGLGGTGRLDGHIPLRLADGKLAITAGHLAARAPGTLRYQPASLPSSITAAGEEVGLLLQALSDFHYQSLALDLDKGEDGEGAILLHLAGSNPAVLSDQPFNLNIRIESNFDRLADLALAGLRSTQELLRRAAGGSGR
jgi:hypothetical protein